MDNTSSKAFNFRCTCQLRTTVNYNPDYLQACMHHNDCAIFQGYTFWQNNISTLARLERQTGKDQMQILKECDERWQQAKR